MKDACIILIACTLFLSLFVITHPINICKASSTITVGPEGPPMYDYSKISYAIDNASAGDSINVYSGTYNENLIINKQIILMGIDGKSSTIINGKDAYKQTIHIKVDDVTINGFTIKNSIGADNEYSCIYLNYTTGCTVSNCLIKDGKDGIDIVGSTDSSIRDNIFEDNEGHGINLLQSNNNDIEYNTIRNNYQNGIKLYQSSSNTIYDNSINGNGQNGINAVISNSNTFFYNDFSDNFNENAYDSGSNSWNYNSQGNFWDDYGGVDENPEDGIGDNPYNIPGGSNQDLYPLGDFIEVNQKPVATILSISPNPAVFGQNVHFEGDATDDGTIINWRWEISGIIVKTSEDFDYSNIPVGTHSVSFKVQDDDLEWSDVKYDTITITSTINTNPIITEMKIMPTDTTYGKSVFFYGEGSDSDVGDSVIGYYWSSDIEGFLSNDNSFSSTTLSIGTHVISFKVKDTYNAWSDISTLDLIINPDPLIKNNKPVCDPGGPYTGYINKSVNFDGSNSYDSDPGDSIISYNWDFGDDTEGQGSKVEHTYNKIGTYTITLIVKDSQGEYSYNTTTIKIFENNQNNNGNGNNKNKDENNNDSNNNTNDKDDDKIVIPGFEIIIIFIALSIFIIIRRKKMINL